MTPLLNIFSPDWMHKFFFFLSTDMGLFFKSSVELVIFLLLSYMVISEYLRTSIDERRQELKYFIIAFSSLLINSALEVLIYSDAVFGEYDIGALRYVWPVLDKVLNLLTLVLLLNAFIYPVFRQRVSKYKFDLKIQLILITIAGIVVEIAWILQSKGSDFLDFWGNYLFVGIEFLAIIYALYELYKYSTPEFKYRGNIFLAFWIYLMVPVVHFINIILFQNDSPRLRLLEEPFPVIAILLLTQVIYLKLVDKAFLKQKLFETQKKYQVEKEISEMKDDFISTVSHELRTPLTSMKLYVSLLNSGKFGKMEEKQKEALGVVKSEADRLSMLIEDILSLSKMEAGKMQLKLEEFDLNELKNPIHYAGAKEKDIGVVFYMPKKFIVRVDSARIVQVFVNLMSNAIKFTDEQGIITISCEDLGEEWTLSVHDTGKGIPKDEIPRLFDKFYQVEDHMTRTKGGTGLGLAIVKKIVDLHKGRIEVESEINKGSRFTIFIPKKI